MSTFSEIKEQRKEKRIKSYTGILGKNTLPDEQNDPMVEVPPGPTREKSYQTEGLYGGLPRDLEVRVHMDETVQGRGIYNLRQRKPGRSPMDLETVHSNGSPPNKNRRCPLVH